ncbi:MAG: electron transfer flavoprotein subunit alpha/FixB family protein, partial [Betaproteobacteria bacterium]|nr:electron transfer flavoprotein subunit alpha/FixB family protein [Betaproteobacteria bacterium]
MSALVIAEHEAGQLKPSTLNTVSAALLVSHEVHVLVAGAG